MDWTDGVDFGWEVTPRRSKQIGICMVAVACLVSAGARSFVGRGIDAYDQAKTQAAVRILVPAFNTSYDAGMVRMQQYAEEAKRRSAAEARSAAQAQQGNGMAQVTVYIGPK